MECAQNVLATKKCTPVEFEDTRSLGASRALQKMDQNAQALGNKEHPSICTEFEQRSPKNW